MEFVTTLEDLRKNQACYSGYNKVVRALQGKPFSGADRERESYIKFSHKDAIPLTDILTSNGLDDALWALQCVSGCDRDIRLFAVWAVRQVENLMTDQRSKDALNVAERFANGEATEVELAAAEAAAWTAAEVGAAAAAGAAAGAAARSAAGAAGRAAAGAAGRPAQKEMFIRMCRGTAPWQSQTA